MCSVRRLALSCLLALACLGRPAPAADEALQQDDSALREAGVDTAGPGLLAFIHKHTASETDEGRVGKLIHLMGDHHYRARERATAELASLGGRAVPFLLVATNNNDLEVARRAERCLQEIERGSGESLLVSAIRLAADRKPAGTARCLLDYLEGTDRDYLLHACLDALTEVAVEKGKPAPALVEELKSRHPRRRMAAAVALTRAGAVESRPAVRKLLNDPDSWARLQVGLALAAAGDREALLPLVELFGELPAAQTGLIEDLFYRAAVENWRAENPPAVPPARTAEQRKKVREAWEQWLRANADKLDLKKLGEERPHGHTLVVMLDAGRVIDVDAGKRVCWEVEGLAFPLDAQVLSGDRVLVAEFEGGRVTERNSKGEVLWEKRVDSPLAAQRLPGGNTFIATAGRLLEVDPKGKEVWTRPSPRGGRIMKATRLRNGDVAVIAQVGVTQFCQLDRNGKEVRSFDVEQRTAGGRVEVLPGGNVLISERDANRVVELDYEGKPVWEARFEQPVAAVRLANGNTLVTSMGQARAVELDRKGREVWEYRADSRVTRAWRY
jgi:hypothetical protein